MRRLAIQIRTKSVKPYRLVACKTTPEDRCRYFSNAPEPVLRFKNKGFLYKKPPSELAYRRTTLIIARISALIASGRAGHAWMRSASRVSVSTVCEVLVPRGMVLAHERCEISRFSEFFGNSPKKPCYYGSIPLSPGTSGGILVAADSRWAPISQL